MTKDEPRLVCDLMLGKLTRWLRIMGYDTIVESDDKKLKRMSTKRIVLTRDKNLLTRKSVIIKSLDIDGQLKEVVRTLKIQPRLAKVRCPLCNGLLEELGKNNVAAVSKGTGVPKKVLSRQNKFWRCKSCGKYYWEGSHWKGIQKRIRKIR